MSHDPRSGEVPQPSLPLLPHSRSLSRPLRDPLKRHLMHPDFGKTKASLWAVPARAVPRERRTGGRGEQSSPAERGLGRGSLVLPPPLSLCPHPRHPVVSQLPSREGTALGRGGPDPTPPRTSPCTCGLCPPPASLPTVHGIKWTCSNGNSSSGFSVEQLVQQILDSHQTKPQPRTHNCLCTGSLGEPGALVGTWAERARPGRGYDVCEGRGVIREPGHGPAFGATPSSWVQGWWGWWGWQGSHTGQERTVYREAAPSASVSSRVRECTELGLHPHSPAAGALQGPESWASPARAQVPRHWAGTGFSGR